jgi:peptidoglycan/xylan/chitin deacetylase (PgdA/CDA1 family)
MVSNFLFHRVNPFRDALWDPMDVPLFEKCVKYISTNFEVRQLEELIADEKSLRSGGKFATIVFDDGYKDNIEYAAPLLDKYKIKASFYVVTDCIDKNIPTWTHILDYSFQVTTKNKIDLPFDFLNHSLRSPEFNDQAARIRYAKQLKPVLKKLSHEDRNKVMEQISLAFDDVELPGLMMNWNDLKELKKAGHYIGSHTITHSMLGTMVNEQEIKKELSGSGEIIRQHLGYFPVSISYPVGSYNDTTIRLSRESGYKIGLAVKHEKFNIVKDGLFEIPRIELYNEPWWKTRLRIQGTIRKFSKLLQRA